MYGQCPILAKPTYLLVLYQNEFCVSKSFEGNLRPAGDRRLATKWALSDKSVGQNERITGIKWLADGGGAGKGFQRINPVGGLGQVLLLNETFWIWLAVVQGKSKYGGGRRSFSWKLYGIAAGLNRPTTTFCHSAAPSAPIGPKSISHMQNGPRI
jgi:hypothetical protein